MVSELVDLPTCPGMAEGADGKQPQPSRAMELLEEFNNLSQGDSLEEYNQRFRELRLWLLSINPYLRESYFIWCYVKGLELKIKSLVQLGRPKELEEAMKLAMLHNTSATQELAQQPNPKPNSSISTLTETKIPNSTSTTFDVLGEGQTLQESDDQDTIKHQEGIEWVTNSQTGAELLLSEFVSQPGQESEASIVDENQLGAPVLDEAFSDDDDDLRKSQEAVEALSQEIGDAKEAKTAYGDELESSTEEANPEINGSSNEFQSMPSMTNELKKPSNLKNKDDLEEPQFRPNSSEVNLRPCEIMNCDGLRPELVKLVNLLIELIEIRIAKSKNMDKSGFLLKPIDCFDSSQKMFGEMPNKWEVVCDQFAYNLIDMGISTSSNMDALAVLWPYDPGKCKHSVGFGQRFHLNMEQVCDYGRQSIRQYMILLSCDKGKGLLMLRSEKVLVDSWIVASTGKGMGLSFDPGGIGYWESVRIAILPNSFKVGKLTLDRKLDHNLVKNGLGSLPFDRGGVARTRRGFSFVFDPGGLNGCSAIAWVLATYTCVVCE